MDVIRSKRGTSSRWKLVNPILESGEMGFETDTGLYKTGDGIREWGILPYMKSNHSPLHGFEDNSESKFEIIGNEFRISPVNISFTLHINANKHTLTESLTISTDLFQTGTNYVYVYELDGVATLGVIFTQWSITSFGAIPMSIVYKNPITDELFIGNERHSAYRDVLDHDYMHRNFGAIHQSGLNLTYNKDTTSFTLTKGVVRDEDIPIHVETPMGDDLQELRMAWNDNGWMQFGEVVNNLVWYDSGNGGIVYCDEGIGLSYLSNGEYTVYWVSSINFTGNMIGLANGTDNNAMLLSILHNNKYDSFEGAESASFISVMNSVTVPTSELKLLYKVIVQQTDSGTFMDISRVDDIRHYSIRRYENNIPSASNRLESVLMSNGTEYILRNKMYGGNSIKDNVIDPEIIYQVRNDSTDNFNASNITLELGEVAYDASVNRMKVGDGVSSWGDLPFNNAYAQTIIVAKRSGDFTSIKDAIDFIAGDAGPTKPYVIKVQAGIYEEDPFSLSPYISIEGSGKLWNTIIKTNNNDTHFIQGAEYSSIYNLSIEGPTGTGAASVVFNTSTQRGAPLILYDVFIRKGNIGVLADGQLVHCFNVANWYTGTPFGTFMKSDNGGYLMAFNCSFTCGNAPDLVSYGYVCDNNSSMTLDVCSFRSRGSHTTTVASYTDNGSLTRINGTTFARQSNAIQIGPNGTNSRVIAYSTVIEDNINNLHDIIVESDSSSLRFNGTASKSKIEIIEGATVIANFSDISTGETVVYGELVVGDQNTSIPLRDYGINTYSTGYISGGIITDVPNVLQIHVSSGSGYINNGTTVQKVAWDNFTSDILTPNTEYYVSVDIFSVVNITVNEPDTTLNVVLGAIYTDGNDVIDISEQIVDLKQYQPNMFEYLKGVIGPISISGGVVQPTGTPDNQLSISEGSYYIHTRLSNTSTQDPAIFSYWHSDGTGGWTTLSGVTGIDLQNYDNSGTLTPIPTGTFKRDLVYISGYNGVTEVHVVYGQRTFNSQQLAEGGENPIIPVYLTEHTLRCAAVITTINDSGIVSIVDQRPKLGQYAVSASVPTNHNDLSNKDGGGGGKYYHLDQSDYNNITAGNFINTSASSLFLGTGYTTHGHTQYINNSVSSQFYQATASTVFEQKSHTSVFQLAADMSVYLTTAAQSGQTVQVNGSMGNISLNGQAGLNVTYNDSTIQIGIASNYTNSLSNTFAQTTHSHMISGSNGSFSASNFVVQGSGAVGVYTNSNGLVVSSPVYVQSVQPVGSFGVSNIGNTLGNTGTVTNSMVLVGGNNVTLSQDTGVYGNTISIIAPSQSQQPMYYKVGGNTTLANTLQFANNDGISFNLTNGSVVATVATNYQSQGAYLTTAAQSGQTVQVNGSMGNISINAGSNLSLSQGSNGITIGIHSDSSNFPFVNTSQSSLFEHVSATSGITSNAMNTSERGGLQYTSATSNITSNALNTSQSSLFEHVSATSGITSNAMNTSERGGLQYTSATSNITSNALNTSQSSLFEHVSATSGITSNAMNTSERGGLQYTSNSSNNTSVYLGIGNSTEYQTGTLSNTFFQTANSSLLQLVAYNSLSLGTGYTTHTHNEVTHNLSYYVEGNSTQVSSMSIQEGSLTFVGNGIASVGMSNNKVGISVPNAVRQVNLIGNTNSLGNSSLSIASDGNIVISGGNNITLSASSNTIMIAAEGMNTLSRWESPIDIFTSLGTTAQGLLSLKHDYIPFNISATAMKIGGSLSMATQNSTTTASVNLSVHMGIYGLTGSTLTLLSSGSANNGFRWSQGNNSTSGNSSITGMRQFTVPMNVNMTPGEYWIACLVSSQTTYTSGAFTIYGNNLINNALGGAVLTPIGGNTSNARDTMLFQGVYSSSTAGLPNSIVNSDINQTSASNVMRANFYYAMFNATY